MPSSTSPAPESAKRIRIAPEEVTLHVWPLKQRPMSSLLAVAIAAAVVWLVGWLWQPWAGGAAAAILALTLWRMWLPVTYEIGVSGVTQVVLGRRRRIPWPAIRNYVAYADGVLLVPDADVRPASPLRGLFLPWLDHREKVLANVEYYVASGA
jgi:hypothetical protein